MKLTKEIGIYLLKKITRYVITIFIATLISFLIPRLMPGDPITAILDKLTLLSGERVDEGSQAVIVQHFIQKFGLDKDYLTQYVLYISNVFRGDLGPSIMAYPRGVMELLLERLPWTIGLLGTATLISWTTGNVLGAFVGFSEKAKTNAVIISLCMAVSRIPYYIFSLLLIYCFVYIIPLFPWGGGKSVYTTIGFNLPFLQDVLYHSFLPALSIVITGVGTTVISMRGLMQSIKGSDFLKFAEAKGLSKNTILMKYAFRNALLPQVTSLGMSLGFMLGGSMLVEWIFAYPGIGRLFVISLVYFDYNTMNAIFLLTIFGVLTANLLIDLLYPLIDPRVKTL